MKCNQYPIKGKENKMISIGSKDNLLRIQQEYEKQLWDNIDYSKTMFVIIDDKVEECYIPKTGILPKTNICLVDEGHFRYVFSNNIFSLKKDAEYALNKMIVEPEIKKTLVNWRGYYKVIEEAVHE